LSNSAVRSSNFGSSGTRFNRSEIGSSKNTRICRNSTIDSNDNATGSKSGSASWNRNWRRVNERAIDRRLLFVVTNASRCRRINRNDRDDVADTPAVIARFPT
jgi:hypothetical protein